MNLLLPHGFCINWSPTILWTNVISNAVVAIAYFSIPVFLGFIAYKRQDFNFRLALFLFSTFIIACGISHVMAVIMIWKPIYIIDNWVMVTTALLSAGTAIFFWLQLPKVLNIPSSAQLTDLNDRLQAEIEQKIQFAKMSYESENRFRLSFDYAAIGMGLVDLNGRWLKVNRSLCLMLGMTEEELLASTFQDITHPDDLEIDLKHVNDLLMGVVDNYQMEKRYFDKSGNIIWINLSASVVRDKNKSPVHFVAQIEDITQRKEQEAKIAHFAYHDTLTNLPNRRLLVDRLNQALFRAKRDKCIISVIFLDIDYFKNINDTFGHDIGDIVIKMTAEKLGSCIRSTDTLGRQSGDEFIIILTDLKHRDDAIHVAENIVKSFSSPLQINSQLIPVTLSLGISIFESGSTDSTIDLMKKADMALYEAKAAGRNGFRLFENALTNS